MSRKRKSGASLTPYSNMARKRSYGVSTGAYTPSVVSQDAGLFQVAQETPCSVQGGIQLLRIYIPAGAEISLLGLLQVLSPSGICLIVRIPPMTGSNGTLQSLIQQVQAVGGTVELAQ